jgi:hypothetical protein
MAEEKTEVISYELPAMVFEERTSWPDSNKLKTLSNKSFLTNCISALVFGTAYFSPEFIGRSALMLAGCLGRSLWRPYRLYQRSIFLI